MAEAVVIARMRKKAAEEEEEHHGSLTRSRSILEDRFSAYEKANRQMWARSTSFANSSRASRSPLTQPAAPYPHAVSDTLSHTLSHGHGLEEANWEEDAHRWVGGSRRGSNGAEAREVGAASVIDGHPEHANSSRGEERLVRDGGDGEERRQGARNGKSPSCFPPTMWRSEVFGSSLAYGAAYPCGLKGRPCANGDEPGSGSSSDGGGDDDENGRKEGASKGEADSCERSFQDDDAAGDLSEGEEDSAREDEEDVILANELEEIDKEVVQEVYNRVSFLRDQVQSYRALAGFLLLMALFITMVFLQADSNRSYEVTAAHSLLVPPGFAPDSSNRFAGASDFYSWLNESIIQQLWQDPPCGDGRCDQPFEFPAFGRFGCEADCGTFPNLTAVTIHFTTSFPSAEALALSSWNLCMQSPVSLCWHAHAQPFPSQQGEFSLSYDIPDGLWSLLLTAPMAGVQGVIQAHKPGMTRLDGVVAVGAGNAVTMGSSDSVTLAAWGGCLGGEGFSSSDTNAALQGGGEVCRQVCESVAVCLQQTCGREVAAKEVAGAFVDCVKNCRTAPSSVLPYGNMSCAQIAALEPPLFANSRCNETARRQAQEVEAITVQGSETAHPPELSTTSGGAGSHVGLGASALESSQSGLAAAGKPGAAHAAEADASAGVVGGSSVEGADGAVTNAARATVASADARTSRAVVPTASATTDSNLFPSPNASAAMQLPNLAAETRPWVLLGSTEKQRMRALQVAVSRAIHTLVKDSCLAGPYMLGLSVRYRLRLTAFLCTLLSGPATSHPLCRFDNATGHQLLQPQELFDHLRYIHRGINNKAVSRQQLRRFIDILIAAMQSVTAMTTDTAADLSTFFHRFDDAIVSTDVAGCSQGGTWLQWRGGVKHNTTIHVGDKVTWVWDDDHPHSLRLAGMGDAPTPFFPGFGGHRLAVSRLVVCSPMNVGAEDDYDDPLPCMLQLPGATNSRFTYTKVFTQPGTYHYESGGQVVGQAGLSSSSSSSRGDAAAPPAMSGTVTVVVPPPEPPDKAFHCAPDCALDLLSNGVCNPACNTPSCAFDGGDCGCMDPLFGAGLCACPPGHARRHDGVCCMSSAVGSDLRYPFSLQRYGPNHTESNRAFAAERGAPLTRFVAEHNRLLIGMFLYQERWGVKTCDPNNLLHLAGWCSNGTSRDPFGINPHFLPSSALYDPVVAATLPTGGATAAASDASAAAASAASAAAASAASAGSGSDSGASEDKPESGSLGDQLLLNPQGLPYGFTYPVDGVDGYPLVFDINLDYQGAMNRLRYLMDGCFIDNATHKVEVSFITHNGESSTFVLTRVTAVVDTGGGFVTSFASLSVTTALYSSSLASLLLLMLQLLYLLGLLWNGVEEAAELKERVKREGSALSYFHSGWNWIDMASLLLQWLAVATWIYLWRAVAAADVGARYDIYEALLEVPRYWQVLSPPEGLQLAVRQFSDLQALINWRSFYFALQGVNLFLLMLRLLKLMDFQPYLGVITRSLALAMPSLLHFFLLAFIVFFCFALYGYIVFGGIMEQFSTLPESLFTCFLIILNENATAYFFERMHGWDLVAGMLFFVAFILLLVFILFNFLIAIIVDAFMTIKETQELATSIAHDVTTIVHYLFNRLTGRFASYSSTLQRLQELGARDQGAERARQRMRRYQSFHRKAKAAVIGGLCRWKGAEEEEMCGGETMAGGGMAVQQRVLQVKGQSIDDISLSMILQRRAERQGSPSSFPGSCNEENALSDSAPAVEELTEQLLQQLGEMRASSASTLPAKPKPKQGIHQIQEELIRERDSIEELKAMVALLAAALPASASASAFAAAGSDGIEGSTGGAAACPHCSHCPHCPLSPSNKGPMVASFDAASSAVVKAAATHGAYGEAHSPTRLVRRCTHPLGQTNQTQLRPPVVHSVLRSPIGTSEVAYDRVQRVAKCVSLDK